MDTVELASSILAPCPLSSVMPSLLMVIDAPPDAVIVIALLSSQTSSLWPPGVTSRIVFGPAPCTPLPDVNHAPDQMGGLARSPSGHSTHTLAPTGGTTARPV